MSLRTYAEINLDNLAYNIGCIRAKVGSAEVIPVIKADAYGHGAVSVAKRLALEGCGMFAVARFEEGMELRESGISQRILLLGRLFPDDIAKALKAGLTLSIFGEQDVGWVEKACDHSRGLPASVHLKLDSGMGRVGLLLHRAPDLFARLVKSRACIWEGLYTHFSTADQSDKTFANLQLLRFREVLAMLPQLAKRPKIVHMAASGAILDLPESYFDAVRPGILMYGHYPSKETSQSIVPRQVMSLKSYVAHLREMPGGHPISYGRRWITPGPTRIAVLPVGYADGLSRRLTNNGEVLIRGRLYPIVGTVTMDYIMVNVGSDPVEAGDEVLLWGESPGGVIQTLDVAERIGTIPYELTCAVSGRVPRIYVGKTG
ncbi:MAG: alanine racemase [Syntrophobacteraceae bacterium]